MTTNTNTPTPELPRQVWLLRFDDGTFLDEWFPSRESVEECIDENQDRSRVLEKSMFMTTVLLHDQDAIDELVYLAMIAAGNTWAPDEFRVKLAAAIARVKGGA